MKDSEMGVMRTVMLRPMMWLVYFLFSMLLGCFPAPPLEPTVIWPTPTATLTLEPMRVATATYEGERRTRYPSPEPLYRPTINPSHPLPAETAAQLNFDCRSLAQLQESRSTYRVKGVDWPRPQGSPAELTLGFATDFQLIHLGFHVGGDPANLEPLLEVLERRGVKTTMFIIGGWAELYPGWLPVLVEGGHEFGNLTYTHADIREINSAELYQEVSRTEEIVKRLIGKTTRPWFRPPYGRRDENTVKTIYGLGFTTVGWTGSSEDWRDEYDEDAMCRSLLRGAVPGAILYASTARPDIASVADRFIGEMQARGYTFVPLTIIASNNPQRYLEPNTP